MIIQSYSISLLIQIGIIVAVTTLFIFMPTKNYLISLFVGYILGIVGIIQKASSFGVNIDNFTEYFEKNRDCFWPQLVTKYAENKQELFQYILQSINSSR